MCSTIAAAPSLQILEQYFHEISFFSMNESIRLHKLIKIIFLHERIKVGSVARDQHGLSSKPTRAILLCPWERYFTALSPAW